MLEFELTEEQSMLVDAIGRFVENSVRKEARNAEEEGAIPEDLIQAGWDFGLLPTAIPEEFGGFGEYSVVTGALAMEEFVAGDLAISLNIFLPSLVALPLMLYGTEDQKSGFLPEFSQEKPPKVTAALTEPVIQFDPRNLDVTAVLDGDNFVLNGRKSLVPEAAMAEIFLVYAQYEGKTQAFLVPTESEGLMVGEREKLMGIKGLATYQISLTECQIPKTSQVGEEDGINFDHILSHSRTAMGAAAVGLARAGWEYAVEYAKNRVQFGEPIAHRQSIAFMLAEMAIAIDAARLMVWETAWKLDRSEPAVQEAAVMKYFVDDMVLKVADQTVQTLGGYGYIREYPAELWLRNARGFSSFDGLAMI
jgi:alkylation response protein AidB-like acyl-CoA dehydrogenase